MKKKDHKVKRRRVSRYDNEFQAFVFRLVKDKRSIVSITESLGIG